jgi:hypothetical protein
MSSGAFRLGMAEGLYPKALRKLFHDMESGMKSYLISTLISGKI